MSELPEVDIIARLMTFTARYGLEELEVEEAGLKVRLIAMRPAAEDGSGATGERYLWQPPVWREPQNRPEAANRAETARPLLAPLTGTFYWARSPHDRPLVEVGQAVEEGQAVGIIEAMKVFTPIEADRAGVVVEIVAQNGQLVQHGDVLLYIDPMAAT